MTVIETIQILLSYGETVTYSEIPGCGSGRLKALRAVCSGKPGREIGKKPLWHNARDDTAWIGDDSEMATEVVDGQKSLAFACMAGRVPSSSQIVTSAFGEKLL